MGILDKIRSTLASGRSRPEPEEDGILETPGQADRRRNERLNARPGTRTQIIDDSTTIVYSLKKTLQSVGYEPLIAMDAESGLSLARTEVPELIVLDIILPVANGFSVLRTLRKDPETTPISIIMMSGNEQAAELFYGIKTGADDFMKKPFARFEVFARIERLLDADRVPRRIPSAPTDSGSDGETPFG